MSKIHIGINLEFVLGNKVMVGIANAHREEWEMGVRDFAHAEGRPGQPEAQIQALWAAYPRLRAVRDHRVKVIASDVLVRPGPRMAEAARALLALIHPEIQLKAGAGKRP